MRRDLEFRPQEMPLTPEQQARQQIDTALAEAGWIVQKTWRLSSM